MPISYFEKDTLKDLSIHDLYYNFKKLEKNLNIAMSSSIIPYETKMELDRYYNYYTEELDRRVDEGIVSTDELDDLDDIVSEELEKESKKGK